MTARTSRKHGVRVQTVAESESTCNFASEYISILLFSSKYNCVHAHYKSWDDLVRQVLNHPNLLLLFLRTKLPTPHNDNGNKMNAAASLSFPSCRQLFLAIQRHRRSVCIPCKAPTWRNGPDCSTTWEIRPSSRRRMDETFSSSGGFGTCLSQQCLPPGHPHRILRCYWYPKRRRWLVGGSRGRKNYYCKSDPTYRQYHPLRVASEELLLFLPRPMASIIAHKLWHNNQLLVESDCRW